MTARTSFTLTKTIANSSPSSLHKNKRLHSSFTPYCLMTNHIHLPIERRAETVGRIMQRVLTGSSAIQTA
jgi:hypothetical protein